MKSAQVCLLLLACQGSIAFGQSTVTGTFTFEKKPPGVALIYFDNQDNDPNFAIAQNPTIDQKNQEFVNEIYVVAQNKSVEIKNSDTIDHNIFANDSGSGVKFDIGLRKPGTVYNHEVTWGNGVAVKVGCMIHPKMKTYVVALNSKYFATLTIGSDATTAKFEIKDVPASLKTIKIWMPKVDEVTFDLDSGKKSVDLAKKGEKIGKLELSR